MVSVVIEVDRKHIKRQITERVAAILKDVLFTWDVNEGSKRTCMSKKFLER